MQNETDYLKRFPEFLIKWTEESVKIVSFGKSTDDSWIAKGGFLVTTLGRTMVIENIKKNKKLKDIDIVLIYIGFHNLAAQMPSVEQIAIRFFKGDFNKSLGVIGGLVTLCALRFVDEDSIRAL